MAKRETSEVVLRDVQPWVSTHDGNRNQSLTRKSPKVGSFSRDGETIISEMLWGRDAVKQLYMKEKQEDLYVFYLIEPEFLVLRPLFTLGIF